MAVTQKEMPSYQFQLKPDYNMLRSKSVEKAYATNHEQILKYRKYLNNITQKILANDGAKEVS